MQLGLGVLLTSMRWACVSALKVNCTAFFAIHMLNHAILVRTSTSVAEDNEGVSKQGTPVQADATQRHVSEMEQWHSQNVCYGTSCWRCGKPFMHNVWCHLSRFIGFAGLAQRIHFVVVSLESREGAVHCVLFCFVCDCLCLCVLLL